MGKEFNNLPFYFILILCVYVVHFEVVPGQLNNRTIASENGSLTQTVDPKRNIDEVFSGSPVEKMKQLSNAKVVMADYDLIRKDFPAIKNLSNPEIDNWLIKQTGYVSIPQANQEITNTRIPTTGIEKDAYRPPRYNRANVFDVMNPMNESESLGIIDVKGTGSLNPRQADHGNGVATLGEVIREFLYERLMRDITHDAEIPNKIVGSYAVIDPGFDVRHADGSTSPAGYYLRQGHDRHVAPNGNEWLPANERAKLQSIFRKYGIDPNENVQGTKDFHIFDFGHFVVRDDMSEIDPNKLVPFDQWGYDKSVPIPSGDRWFHSKIDKPWNWSHEVADAWRQGSANRHNVWQHFDNLLGPAQLKLKAQSANCADMARNILNN